MEFSQEQLHYKREMEPVETAQKKWIEARNLFEGETVIEEIVRCLFALVELPICSREGCAEREHSERASESLLCAAAIPTLVLKQLHETLSHPYAVLTRFTVYLHLTAVPFSSHCQKFVASSGAATEVAMSDDC